jgi:hypothetical protein
MQVHDLLAAQPPRARPAQADQHVKQLIAAAGITSCTVDRGVVTCPTNELKARVKALVRSMSPAERPVVVARSALPTPTRQSFLAALEAIYNKLETRDNLSSRS